MNKEKKTIGIVLRGFFLFSFTNFTIGFHGFHLIKLEIIEYDFRKGARKRSLEGKYARFNNIKFPRGSYQINGSET